jgi:hypothetical protein
MFGKLINWVKFSIAKVPEEIAICEFECHKNECRMQDWAHCERRLRACNTWTTRLADSQGKKPHHRSH